MGKGTLIVAAAVVIGTSMLLFGSQRSGLDMRDEQSVYEEKGFARSIGQSGFDEALSTFKRTKSITRTQSEVAMDDGAYQVGFSENMYGDLDLLVTANSGETQHTVNGNLIFETSFPSALAIEDDELDFRAIGNSYTISGVDYRMPSRQQGGKGFLEPTYAVMTEPAHLAAIDAALNPARVEGKGRVHTAFDSLFYEQLYQAARLQADLSLQTTATPEEKQQAISQVLQTASPGNPKIIHVEGPLILDNTYDLHGFGMLMVNDGDFHVSSSRFNWEGIIMVRKQEEDTVRISFSDSPAVYGSTIAYSWPSIAGGGGGGGGTCTPDFDITGDDVIVHDAFRLRIEVLGAAISAGGSYDMPVTTKIVIGDQEYEPFGNWDSPLTGNVNTGNSGTTYLWEPDQTFPPETRVTIRARSWQKRTYQCGWYRRWGRWYRRYCTYSGSEDAHWQVYMEHDSNTDSQQLEVLRDGSAVPNVGGYMGQTSAEDFVSDYIDFGLDQMTMEDNQAINLFELGSTNPSSSAFDMQDLVSMVSLVKVDPGGGGTIACSGGTPAANRIEFTIYNQSQFVYSPEAIAKLGNRLDLINDAAQVVVTRREGTTCDPLERERGLCQ
ncbi:MAG: hypothetical protein ACE5G0_18550 [Rhodothermales bacterium]